MAGFQFRQSKMFYPEMPINYLQLDVKREDKFPCPDGQFIQRDFNDDLDNKVDPAKIDLKAEHHLPYEGKKIFQDPINEGEHSLHPIEVVIDDSVLQEIAEFGREVCGGNRSTVKETAGFLAGKLKRDRNKRLWTHVTKSIHKSPVLYGEPDKVVIDKDTQNEWSQEIKKLGLERVGMWHTHPTYEPFQSDSRAWGADVQATASNCQHWWSFSMVVDPFGDDSDSELEREDGVKRAVAGCYKMVHPGVDPADLTDPLEMGWRSVTFGIRKEG